LSFSFNNLPVQVMELIDTHAHIYQDDFDTDLDELVTRAKNARVNKVVLPNVDVPSIQQMILRVNQYPEFFKLAVGLHPCYVKENFLEDLEILYRAAKGLPIVAIGEIGLDYHWDLTFINNQMTALMTQLDWAYHLQLPVILHCRESVSDVIHAVSPFAMKGVGGIFHCFSGTLEEAKSIIEMGFYIGVGGTFTYKKSELPTILRQIGLERVVLETDSPYLSPVPHRGKRNEPSYIPLVANKIAETLDISVDEVAEITSKNAQSVFRGSL
jgi:TatD DNase family protein